MSVVREEFGPTLPELLGERLRMPVRTIWRVVATAGVLVVLVLAWLVFLRDTPGQAGVVVRGPVTYNLIYTDALRRVAPRSGESLRLQSKAGPPQSFAVRTLRLAPYKGDVSAALTLLSARLIREMEAQYPGFLWRGDGRVNVNQQPGYQIVFQARVGGRTTYGKRVLLVSAPDPPPGTGLDITMLSARSPAIPRADAVAANGALKTPLRSLRFGTKRP
jgi:hypothetical protein